MEKKRRARINTSLIELKTMLAGMITEKVHRQLNDLYELNEKIKHISVLSLDKRNSTMDGDVFMYFLKIEF